MKIHPIAIHLPQFHPIPENDAWWGKGFTEWTNVAKAQPLFKGHYQPQLPTRLGFCDLRLEETRVAQAELARQYGIYGFCYYHYWFNGKRLLNRPVDDMLVTGNPNFPFMLFWANESWSRRWWGEEKEVLIKQTYNEEDDVNHINWLCEKAFSDSRYITIHGRPAFVIYRPDDLPSVQRTIEIFKEITIKKGLPEPFIIARNSYSTSMNFFDYVLNFEPEFSFVPGALANDKLSFKKWLRNIQQGIASGAFKVYDYNKVQELMRTRKAEPKTFPCVLVGFDNTARRGKNAVIFNNQNKNAFKASLLHAKHIVQQYPAEERLVFINAWNEWAEGNHLEPCRQYGTDFLDAVKEVFK